MNEQEPVCYACARHNKAFHEKRKKCMKRRSHKPQGEGVIHEGRFMQQCADCSTLVVPV